MVLAQQGRNLALTTVPHPQATAGQLLLRVDACAVCRTDLHILDGELPKPKLPLVPGHEIVGTVAEIGAGVERFALGDRVGVPWLGWTCGSCGYCRAGRENLCPRARFTGYDIDGGYAEHTVADARFCFPLTGAALDAPHLAPLLCAGLIGYRALRMATGERPPHHTAGDLRPFEVSRLGIYGFGAAAHIATQVARFEGRDVFAFTRAGDSDGQRFALELGATWAGSAGEEPPQPLDAVLIFAPVGALVPQALRIVRPGGVVVCAGIHMSDIPAFPYSLLWGERAVRSVANLTRRDGDEFLSLASRIPVRTHVEEWPLEDANEALGRLRAGRVRGAAVVVPTRDMLR